MKSSKNYISEYIILKILRNEYKAGEVVYSENRLAIKFKCSRLTARSALINLTSIGILDSFKGLGYVVSDRALNIIFYAKSLKDSSFKSEYSKIEKLNIFHPLINIDESNSEIYVIKNRDCSNSLISLSYIVLDKKALNLYYSNNYSFESNNPIDDIVDSSFIPTSTADINLTVEIKSLDEDLLELGYATNTQIPIIDQSLLNNKGKIAIRNFNIRRRNDLVYSNVNKILTNSSKLKNIE